jgi:iron-sulfur cluster assembly accessory protein
MVTITDAAAEKIVELANEDGGSNVGLRIFIEKGGCSGLQYTMQISAPNEGDQTIEHAGASLFLDNEAAGYLKGSVIDYSDSLSATGFRIQNPNAKRTCGCGTSFQA